MLMRDSYSWRAMMKSMTNRKWIATENIEGRYEEGNLISADDANIFNMISPRDLPIIYFKGEDGNLYARVIESYAGDYSYNVTEYKVSKENGLIIEGEFPQPRLYTGINSNYALWEMLGGFNSYDFESKTGKLVPSEKSIELTVEIMNRVGIKLNDEVSTQEDIYQFMKHSDIHYMATEGAVKQGAANINSNDYYTNGKELDFMTIKMNQAGIQLDKEHEADGEDVSLMTQVISACVARGYTFEEASDLYNALAELARTGLENELSGLEQYLDNGNSEKLEQLIVEKYINSLLKDSNPS
jgi:hypothetical protein